MADPIHYDPLRRQRNQGWRRFTAGMLLYAVIVMSQGLLLDTESMSGPLAVLLALLPVAAALWAMTGWLSAVRTFDEMQRSIISEAGLLSLGATAVLTFTYGFLESLAGAPKLSMFFVVPVIALGYVLALPFVKGRYK